MQTPFGPRLPLIWHREQRVSASGRYLLYLVEESPRLRLLDLQTGGTRIIDLNGTMPDTQRVVAAFSPIWSPYSDDRFIINCIRSVSGGVAFLVDRESGAIERDDLGWRVIGWLPGSKPGRDSILINFRYVYCLQTGEYTERPDYWGFAGYSPDGKYVFRLTAGDINHPNGRYFLNDVEFYLSRPVLTTGQASWSPDGSKIALAVWPGDVPKVEIWILHIDEYLAGESDTMPMHVINLEDQFCFYSGAIYPEYATDSTLIVAMHRDGDEFSGLWEISDKAGDTYKRSLTSPED